MQQAKRRLGLNRKYLKIAIPAKGASRSDPKYVTAYDKLLPETNMTLTASFCALNLRIKF